WLVSRLGAWGMEWKLRLIMWLCVWNGWPGWD
ncbi:unnamed protein product, partial [marine sediment metagenome]